jgi:type IV pilus assembly protein PilA
VTYNVTYPTVGYADDLAKLGSPSGGTPVSASNAGLLDWVLGCAHQPCQKSGYRFTIVNATGSPVATYGVTGVPVNVGVSGNNGFCSDRMNPLLSDPAGGTNCTVPVQ